MPENRTSAGLDLLAAAAVLLGLLWAIAQFAFNSAAMGQNHQELVDCGVRATKDHMQLLTFGVCAAVILACAAAVARRPQLALALVGVEGVLALVWFGIGAWDAASCAIE